MNPLLFSNTPMIKVSDNRGLVVRDIAYHRHPDMPDNTEERITRHTFDAYGFLTQSADPRLYQAKTGLANFTCLTDLSGSVLRTQGSDNGTTVTLNDISGRPFMMVSNIGTTDDGREERGQAITRTWQYEDAPLPGRLLSVAEQTTDGVSRIAERLAYAGHSDTEKAMNLAGSCVSHYDTAGLMQKENIALNGTPLSVTRRLLKNADNPDTQVDWRGADTTVWLDRLEPATAACTTLTATDATGLVRTTTDAAGNQRRMTYDVAGLLSGSWLTVKGGKEQVILASLTYTAARQKQREVHGNGVVTIYIYEPETQRLAGIKTERPAGHASGAKVLQNLRYKYDPSGNVLSVRNDAEEARCWRNQKVVPENLYVWDSLYQLVSATGREMANASRQGSNLPSVSAFDNVTCTNYTRTWRYDRAGNLTQVRHYAPATNNSYTIEITVSHRSNRGVLSTLTDNPAEVDALFTPGGQQKQLLPGQLLSWTTRNELLRVTPVVHNGAADGGEHYRYDSSSQRVLKVNVQKTASSIQRQRVLYLPGLELRSTSNGSAQTENLQVICPGETGGAQVRVLHWDKGLPDSINNDQLRYSYGNLIGSSMLEVDQNGRVITLEEYYPYGGTAVWTARQQMEAGYKTIRYSNKERDATGLYYYGYRYYQPWAGRWLSADPAGTADGLNLFRMVQNSPISGYDPDGRKRRSPNVAQKKYRDKLTATVTEYKSEQDIEMTFPQQGDHIFGNVISLVEDSLKYLHGNKGDWQTNLQKSDLVSYHQWETIKRLKAGHEHDSSATNLVVSRRASEKDQHAYIFGKLSEEFKTQFKSIKEPADSTKAIKAWRKKVITSFDFVMDNAVDKTALLIYVNAPKDTIKSASHHETISIDEALTLAKQYKLEGAGKIGKEKYTRLESTVENIKSLRQKLIYLTKDGDWRGLKK